MLRWVGLVFVSLLYSQPILLFNIEYIENKQEVNKKYAILEQK
jgi:hypothetical protein